MKNYYKINEISKLYNIGVDSIRYYEELGILHPKRASNGYRQYTTNDIHRLNVIRDLRSLGFSMQSIKAYLENQSISSSLAFMEKEEKIKKDSILIFCGISDRVKRKGFETEHEEKELLWISKIWLLSYTLRSCAASQRQGIS